MLSTKFNVTFVRNCKCRNPSWFPDKNKTAMLLDRFRFCPSCGSPLFEENDDRSKRCGACGFTYYMNASGAYVAFITDGRGRLLVARRALEPAKGTLDLPGGFADPGETAEEGVRREVMEETGLSVRSARYMFSIPNTYVYSGMTIPTLDLFFECEVDDFTALLAHDDVAECMWVNLSEIDPAAFGLKSVSEGVARYVAMKAV